MAWTLDEMISSCEYGDENFPSSLCWEHKRCRMYKVELTRQFILKPDQDASAGDVSADITCPLMNSFTVLNQTFDITCVQSSNYLEIKLKDNQNKDISTPKPEPIAITLMCATDKKVICGLERSNEEKHWYLKLKSCGKEEDVISLFDGSKLLYIHFVCPNAHLLSCMEALVHRNRELLRNQVLCDVFFDFQTGESVGAHSEILSMRSPIFEANFKHSLKVTRPIRIRIPDTDFDLFKMFLVFLYTSQLPKMATVEHCKSLYGIGYLYKMEDLKDVAGSFLGVYVNASNVVDLLIFANRYSCDRLRELCLETIKNKAEEICSLPSWFDFYVTMPDLCDNAIRHIISAGSKTKAESSSSAMDVLFELPGGECLEAHTSLLSNQSSVFQKMFQEKVLAEKSSNKIKIEDARPEIFKMFLVYLYTGQISATTSIDFLKELLAMGIKFKVEKLVKDAEDMLSKSVLVSNVIDLLTFAELYSCDKLIECCLKVVEENFKVVCFQPGWDDLHKKSPQLTLIAMRRIMMTFTNSKNSSSPE